MATAGYEDARAAAQSFAGRTGGHDVAIICRNTTEAINHLAYRLQLAPDDVVVVESPAIGAASVMSAASTAPGREEYWESEKYQIRVRDWTAEPNITGTLDPGCVAADPVHAVLGVQPYGAQPVAPGQLDREDQVLAVRDEMWSERPLAVVVLREGSSSVRVEA